MLFAVCPSSFAADNSSSAGVDGEFIDSSIDFGFDIFNKCEETSGYKDNVFISPYSIAAAVALIYNGAAGKTAAEIEKALHIKTSDLLKYNSQCKAFRTGITKADPKITIEIANSLWAKNGMIYKKKFSDFNMQYHNAESLILTTAETVNGWISDKTRGKITKVVEESDVVNSILMLINAIYFKGAWSEEFDKKATTPAKFNAPGGEIDCKMMCASGNYDYFENEELQAIYLPYGNKKTGMFVFLPAKNVKYEDFIKNLNAGAYKRYLDSFSNQKGRIELPKFKIEYFTALNDQLKDLGIKSAFENDADFKNIFETSKNVLISKVLHKAFVEVNEEGTEAAAVTVIMTREGSSAMMKPEKTFNMIVDRPFFFAIAERDTKAILFMGGIKKPE